MHEKELKKELRDNIDDQKARISLKKGAMIAVAGQTGEGKTTIAVKIAEYFQGFPLDFEKQLAMGGTDFTQKREVCIREGLPVIIYDEAGDLIGKRAMSKFNIDLVRDFELQRAFKLFVILVLPSFRTLDSSLFDERGLVRAVVQVYERTEEKGFFSWYGRSKTNRLLAIMSDRKKRPPITDHLFLADKSCYVRPDCKGTFIDLPEKRSAELETFSLVGKRQILDERAAKDSGLLNYNDIVRKTGKSLNYIRATISNNRFKPERRIGRTPYFDPSVVDLFGGEQTA